MSIKEITLPIADVSVDESSSKGILNKALFFGVLPREGFVRLEKILEVIPVSEATWWAGVKSGKYAKPKHPSPGTTAWDVADIRALMEEIRHG